MIYQWSEYTFLWSESNQRLITCFLGQEVPIKPFSYNLLVFVDFLGRSSKSWNSRTDIPLLDIKWREMAHYGTSFAKIMLFGPFSINVLPPPWPLLFSHGSFFPPKKSFYISYNKMKINIYRKYKARLKM